MPETIFALPPSTDEEVKRLFADLVSAAFGPIAALRFDEADCPADYVRIYDQESPDTFNEKRIVEAAADIRRAMAEAMGSIPIYPQGLDVAH